MIYLGSNWQGKGKTATGIALVRFLFNHGYQQQDLVGNLHFKRWPGALSVQNEEMIDIVRRMVKAGIKHKILFLDEVDKLFPNRFWHDRSQTEALIGMWQDEKLYNQIICTEHATRNTDNLIRDVAEIEYIPNYVKEHDRIYFDIINKVKGRTFWRNGEIITQPLVIRNKWINHVSQNIFPFYDRWETTI